VRLKLDENLGRQAQEALAASGHDIATVHDEGLASATDTDVLTAATSEQRALVTLDLDFANPLRFNPSETSGIVVLRVPDTPGRSHVVRACIVLCDALERADPTGRLWVVDRGRVRQYEDEN
jgi:predicted nuclease of predicted toxin-antitoxin system